MKAYRISKASNSCDMVSPTTWEKIAAITEQDEKQIYKDNNLYVSETSAYYFIAYRRLSDVPARTLAVSPEGEPKMYGGGRMEPMEFETELLNKKKIQIILSCNGLFIYHGVSS